MNNIISIPKIENLDRNTSEFRNYMQLAGSFNLHILKRCGLYIMPEQVCYLKMYPKSSWPYEAKKYAGYFEKFGLFNKV